MDYHSDILELQMYLDTLSLDTEATGLRPYHGDVPFCVTISTAGKDYLFDLREFAWIHEREFQNLLSDPHREWYMHNARFDLHMLNAAGYTVEGIIYDTKVGARLLHNDHMQYSLKACAERIGETKDDSVEKYIEEHKLFTYRDIAGKNTREKVKHFDRVPMEILSKYARQDSHITRTLGESQKKDFKRLASDTPKELPSLYDILTVECKLTKVVFDMEKSGLLIDRDYCMRAALYETAKAQEATVEFEKITTKPFLSSPKLFAEIFVSEKDKWTYTEKNNPSFDSDALTLFDNPAAKAILNYRDAKSRADFYTGFLHHADAFGVVHPSFDQAGTATGRFSSSNPNFQNLSTEVEQSEFQVRRCIVPRPEYTFVSMDYLAAEYRMMLELAGRLVGFKTPLIQLVLDGADVHQATADLVKKQTGKVITRSQAKTVNFATLYGSGNAKLADNLKVSIEEASALKAAIFSSAPEIKELIRTVTKTAESRGWIFNWVGRRSHFPDPRFAYRAPNHLIQGACADVMKVAMVSLGEYLKNKKSRIILQVHDELLFEVHETEQEIVPELKRIMENAFPFRYLGQVVDISRGDKNFGELT